ncbi:M24 family metallopeptidase [Desulfovulcanus sp.]
MFEPLEKMEEKEIARRLRRLRGLWEKECPDCQGVFIFSRLNIYYFAGTWSNGLLFIPFEGEPILMCRRGQIRAKLESPLKNIVPFKSYGQVEAILHDFGHSLPQTIGVEKTGISWALADSLQKRVVQRTFLAIDQLIARTRALKTEWEIKKMDLAGRRHHQALYHLLPQKIKPGMTERGISIKVWEIFFALGHHGMMRMQNCGEEIFLGHVAAGDSANYPSVFNGPVGLRGQHPAVLHMGYAGKIWQENEPLVVDVGFCLEGYQTDKTQVYFPEKWKPRPEVVDAYKVCVEVQQFLAENLKPGAVPAHLYEQALKIAEKSGFGEGFMALGANKVKFVGHGIGLAIDEYPVIAKGFDEPLGENMVLALEPKIGLPGIGMVGVENTFLVTANGGRCLTGQEYNPVLV